MIHSCLPKASDAEIELMFGGDPAGDEDTGEPRELGEANLISVEGLAFLSA